VGYMCAFRGCYDQVRVEGPPRVTATPHWGHVTLSSGDAVFCSS